MSESSEAELLDHGESTESGDLRRVYLRVGVIALAVIVGVGAWYFVFRDDGASISGGAKSAQEFLDSFPDELECTGERTAEGARMQCWEPMTTFYGCEPGGPLRDDPAMKCREPLVNYFWYADSAALDDFVTEIEENSAGCVVRSERSLVVTYGVLDQLQPTDDPEILQEIGESFSGPFELVGETCP